MEYKLEEYKGRATRHQCPQCKAPLSFTYYVDGSNNIIDKRVGRCNHESGCGYHYTPKQWFSDNPTDREQSTYKPQPIRPFIPPKAIDYLPDKYVNNQLSGESYFIAFLKTLFDEATILRLINDYRIGV